MGTDADDVFDAVIARSDYPMWIVTVATTDRRAGCLIGFATQVSITPRRFLACLSKANHTYEVARSATHLAVHSLGADSQALAALFGSETGSTIDKFAHCDWREGPHGLPVLTAAAGWFTGRILQRDNVGDHVGMLLSPTAASRSDDPRPALRYRSVASLTPGHEADAI